MHTTHFPLITVIALLGACVADDSSAPQTEVEFHTSAIQQPDPISVEEAGREALRLCQALAARLDERGVTLEELQAAVDVGDAQRVRQMFGYTPEEYDEANARALAVAAMVVDSMEVQDPGGAAAPEGLSCEPGIMECGAPFMLAAWAQPQFGAAFLVFGAAICGISRCSWDDGSGPRPKQP